MAAASPATVTALQAGIREKRLFSFLAHLSYFAFFFWPTIWPCFPLYTFLSAFSCVLVSKTQTQESEQLFFLGPDHVAHWAACMPICPSVRDITVTRALQGFQSSWEPKSKQKLLRMKQWGLLASHTIASLRRQWTLQQEAANPTHITQRFSSPVYRKEQMRAEVNDSSGCTWQGWFLNHHHFPLRPQNQIHYV